MPEEPAPGMDGGMDPMAGDTGEMTGKVKEIVDTANAISEKDRDTLLKYARSLKDASEEAAAEGGMPGGEQMPPQDPGMGGGQPPMMESVMFTKRQLKKLNEGLGVVDDEVNKEKKPNRTTKVNKEVTPFDPPKKS